MKYVFILNSFTLKNKLDSIYKRINDVALELKLDYVLEVNDLNNSTEDIVSKYKNKEVILCPVGGDGIINRVINAMNIKKNILSFIPYGTGNDFNRSVKELDDGVNDLDLIKINNKYFINTACFGIDSDVANSKIIKYKWIPKSQRYNVSAINSFFRYKVKNFKVFINDEVISDDMTTIAVCNGMYYGGGYYINPLGKLNDSLFEVYVAPRLPKVLMFKLILSMKKGKHLNSSKISKYTTNKLTIEVSDKISANIDGEELIDDKFVIELAKDKIKVLYNKDLVNKILI